MSIQDRNYLLKVVRNAGVPDLWVECAASDVWLYCWQRNDWRKMVINRRSIDAARKYGWHTRYGGRRDHYELDAVTATVDPYAIVDRMIDAERLISGLSERQRAVLSAEVSGTRGGTNSHHRRLCDVRKKLREAVL